MGVPLKSGGILLDLTRMNEIIEIDNVTFSSSSIIKKKFSLYISKFLFFYRRFHKYWSTPPSKIEFT